MIAVFAEFVADEGAGCGTPHGAQRAAQHRVSGNSPDHGAYAGAAIWVLVGLEAHPPRARAAAQKVEARTRRVFMEGFL